MILRLFMVLVIACNSYCFGQYVRRTQDPNYQIQPNIKASMHGVDLPKRGPLTFELTDVSKKGQLFELNLKTDTADGVDYLPLGFYTQSGRLSCASDYDSKYYSNYEEYAFDSSTSTVVGFDLSFSGPQLSLTSGAQYDKAKSSNNNREVQQGSGSQVESGTSETSDISDTNESERESENYQSDTKSTDVGKRVEGTVEGHARSKATVDMGDGDYVQGSGGYSQKARLEVEKHANYNTETSSETGNRQASKSSNSVTTGMDVRNNKRTTNDLRTSNSNEQATSSAAMTYNSITMVPPPNSAKISVGYSNKESRLQKFFKKENGSVTKGKARCAVYDVVIDIESKHLVLQSSFADAIKKIDKASSKAAEKESMKNLMDNFGTHYSKKTTMGVGFEFETRFTEKDNLKNDVTTKDSCNRLGAHVNVFGVGGGGNYENCPQNWRNVSQTVMNSGLKKFESKSYGVPTAGTSSLADWAKSVNAHVEAGTIQPLPIKEDLVPIFDILKKSQAVKNLKNDNGTLVNHEKIVAIAAEWFGRYCNLYECKESTCADKVEMNGEIYQDTKIQLHYGSKLYESEQTGDYLFNIDGWTIAHGSNYSNVKHKSLACPQENVDLHEAVSDVNLPYIDSWSECADQCQDRGSEKCSYWQHYLETKECKLIKDFAYATYINSTRLVNNFGPRDCPADGKTLFSSGINCPENSGTKSMWERTEDNVFYKSYKLKAFDADITLITSTDGNEIIGDVSENKKKLPNFPPDFGVIEGHSMILTKGDHKILTCIDKACYELGNSKWKHHSELNTERRHAIPISMPNGVYLFGGSEQKSVMTSSFLPMHEKEWEAGPKIPSPGIIKGCGVPVSSEEIMFIGGQDTKIQIIKCNVNTKEECTKMPMSLQTGRYSHSCKLFGGNKILVTGGKDRNGRDLKSTEVIDLSSNTTERAQDGDLKQPRSEFALVSPGSGEFSRILAIGGNSNGAKLNSIEYWMEEEERWDLMPRTLTRTLSDIGYLDVPSIALDQRFKDNAKSIQNLQDDLKKDLGESDCNFDPDLNTLLENCAEPWNEGCRFKVKMCLQKEKEKEKHINEAALEVMSKLPSRLKREVTVALSYPFSSVEVTDDFKDMIARCSMDEYVEKQWFLHPQEKCNNLTYAKDFDDYALLKSPRILRDGCEPKWISMTQRASFYIDCTERFNINGFLSSGTLNIREMNNLARKLRKHEKDSATARIGGGAAQVVGGLMSGLGIVLAPITGGGSLALTVLGAGSAIAGSTTSAVVSFGTNSEAMTRKAKKREIVLKKNMDFLEKLLIMYMGSSQDTEDDYYANQISQNTQRYLEDKIVQQLRAMGSVGASTTLAIQAIKAGTSKFLLNDAVAAAHGNSGPASTLTKRSKIAARTKGFVKNLKGAGSQFIPKAFKSLAKSTFALRATKAFKSIGKGVGKIIAFAAPMIDIGFGIWDIIDGTKQLEGGGISNNLHVHSTSLSFRLQEMANLYTATTGIEVTQQSIKNGDETIDSIHVYADEGVWMKLRIKSGSKKPCTTDAFKTELRSGTERHTFVSGNSLGDCDGHLIINGTAEIKVVSSDSNVVRVNEVNFNTNGRFIPSISCEYGDVGEVINVEGKESREWQECKTKNAISKIKTHTSSLEFSGTDAGIEMTFMLRDKKENEEVWKCDKIKMEHFENHKKEMESHQIDIFHLANLGFCQKLLGDINEGFWDDGRFQLSVELYNDGTGAGPAWHFDLLKIYFMGDYETEKIVRCAVNGDGVDLFKNERKVINCELYQPRQPLRSLEALGVHTCDLYNAGSDSDKLRLRFCRTEEYSKSRTNDSDGVNCCEMNRFGYLNSVDLNRDETLKIDGNEPLDNGELDDGGDKLGQCEGFEIYGKEVYVTVQNPYHGAWCLDELQFYGKSKIGTVTDSTPFTSCRFTPIWAENNYVYRQDGNGSWVDKNYEHHRDVPFRCEMGNHNQIMSMEIKVCDKPTAGTEAEFVATFTNWNHGTCSTSIGGSIKPNEFLKQPISRECKNMDAGYQVRMMIANHNEDANDDVCLEDIYLNVAAGNNGTQLWQCTIDGNAHFAMDFQGENTGLPLVCAP